MYVTFHIYSFSKKRVELAWMRNKLMKLEWFTALLTFFKKNGLAPISRYVTSYLYNLLLYHYIMMSILYIITGFFNRMVEFENGPYECFQ